ncbi:TPA: hypothetical protein ACL4OO_002011, partial [Streptococcus pneumoniae]|uniref:hypothetical protein n=5 Tax=Streptococcus pneumoniae TaxID=1313 RepID=UPI001BB215BA
KKKPHKRAINDEFSRQETSTVKRAFLIPGNIIAYPLKLTYNQNPAKEKDKSIEDRAKTVLTFILSNSNMRSKDKKPSEINLRT